jgi:hypothetical protein
MVGVAGDAVLAVVDLRRSAKLIINVAYGLVRCARAVVVRGFAEVVAPMGDPAEVEALLNGHALVSIIHRFAHAPGEVDMNRLPAE